MFDTLDEKIKQDDPHPRKERFFLTAAVAVLSVLLFGGLYMLVRLSE